MSPAWESVGALRKYAGGIFLASDLGGYAAVASSWFCTAQLKWVAGGRPRPLGARNTPYNPRYTLSRRLPAITLPGSRAVNASALRQSSAVSTLLINTQPVS